MTQQQELARAAILRILTERSVYPTQLLEELRQNFEEADIKDGVLRLLREGLVELSPELYLHIQENPVQQLAHDLVQA